MQIKKTSKDMISIINEKTRANLIFDGLNINLSFEESNFSVKKPGEYEVSGVTIFAKEIRYEAYKANINFLMVGYKNYINLMTVTKPLDDASDDGVIKSDSVNIIILNNLTKEMVTSLKKFRPEVMVIIKSEDINAESLQDLSKDYQVTEVTDVLKIDDAVFNSEEDSIKYLYILA